MISAANAGLKGLGAALLICADRSPEPLLVFGDRFLLRLSFEGQ